MQNSLTRTAPVRQRVGHVLKPSLWIAAVAACSLACYSMRGSSGGGEIQSVGKRRVDARDVAVPRGYKVEVVASGLTFPTGVCFDAAGQLFVVESGYCYGEVWTTPRVLRVEAGGATSSLAEGGRNGPWNGIDWADG